MNRIGILDLGAGGLAPMSAAVRGLSIASVHEVSTPGEIATVDAVVVPAIGSFEHLAAQLRDGVGQALRAHVAAGKPLLGVGAGMHVLFDGSDEAPASAGLGLMAGRCVALESSMEPMTRERTDVPHLGWNRLVIEQAGRSGGAAPLPQGAWVYFDHRFHVVPRDMSCVLATVEHGSARVAAAVARGNVLGVQFRPERSGAVGLRILHALLSRWS